jgi:MFS family permease
MSLQRNVRLLQWFNFFLDFRPQFLVLVLYMAEQTGSYAVGMSVIGLTTISSAIFEVPTGILSDLAGRRRTMMMGSIAATIGTALTAMGGSLLTLCAGSIFVGISLAFFSGNNNAFLHDTLKQEGREKEFPHFLGITSALFQLGLGLSALLGGFLSERALSLAVWAGVIPQALCIVIAFFMIEPKRYGPQTTNAFAHLGNALREFQKNARLRALSLASVLDFGLGQAQFLFFPAFFAQLLPLWAIGATRLLAHFLAFLSYWFSGRIIKKFTAFPVLLSVKIVSSSVAIGAYILNTVASPIILSCISVLFGMKMVSENTLFQREFTDEQRATMGSVTQFFGSILFAISSVALGLLADNVGPMKTLIITEVILLGGTGLYWKAFRHKGA